MQAASQAMGSATADARDSHWSGIYKEHLPFSAHRLAIAARGYDTRD
jgi:hypothetical protein